MRLTCLLSITHLLKYWHQTGNPRPHFLFHTDFHEVPLDFTAIAENLSLQRYDIPERIS